MADYANEYKQSLENIKMLQDMFISLTIAIAFALSAALLLPLLMGISIIVVVQYGLIALLFMDIALIFTVQMFIPSDKLSIDLGIPDEGQKRIRKWLYIISPFSVAILIVLMFFAQENLEVLTEIKHGSETIR